MCVYREDPEGPEDAFAPENPETWPIVVEQQRREQNEQEAQLMLTTGSTLLR